MFRPELAWRKRGHRCARGQEPGWSAGEEGSEAVTLSLWTLPVGPEHGLISVWRPSSRAPRNGGRIRCTKATLPFLAFVRLSKRVVLYEVGPQGKEEHVTDQSLHTPHLCFLFQDIDKFGNEITQLARPLPVEYLIIDVSALAPPGLTVGALASDCWPVAAGGWQHLEGRAAPRRHWSPKAPGAQEKLTVLMAFSFSFSSFP